MADNDIHVVPVSEMHEHVLSIDCPCEPTVEVVGAVLVITHNAWDFREIAEELNEEAE